MERPAVTAANQVWAMDFVSDALFDGHRFRALTVVDAYTRECLAIEVDRGLKGEQVVAMMDRVRFLRGMVPGKIKVDNGPEFVSRALGHWAYIESFNGRLRDECLNTHWFLSLDDARAKIEVWRRYYNEGRPHTSLGYKILAEFASLPGVNPGQ